MIFLKRENNRNGKLSSDDQYKAERGVDWKREAWDNVGVNGTVFLRTRVIDVQLHIFVKIHSTTHYEEQILLYSNF